MLTPDRVRGALLGIAVGDALGMPIDGLSHQNVRTYYKGIKGYRADEHRRDFGVGQWTSLTQRTFALVRALSSEEPHATVRARYAEEVQGLDLRRAEVNGPSAPIVIATPLALWWASEGATPDEAVELMASALGIEHSPETCAASVGHAAALRYLLDDTPGSLDGRAFLLSVAEQTRQAEERLDASHAVSDRLRLLADHLDDFPLDLQDLCGGTHAAADEAWPFAVAMVARNPTLLEATVLPAINVGGAASTIGACVGALVGALHGWAAFPADWRDGLEDSARLEAEATAFAEAMLA